MKKIPKLLSLGLVLTLLLSGCGDTGNTGNNTNNNGTSNNNGNTTGSTNENASGTPVEADFSQTESDMFSNRDSETTYSSGITIKLNGSSASCDSSAVEISGSTITIKDEGTYILSGTLDDGMIIVDAKDSDKPQLVFDNVTINSETSAPVYILEADKVFITLADGSTNTLSNGGTFTAIDENNIDGAIYSKQDLTFNGSGSLTVTSPAGHGIVCKDDLVFTSGTYNITSSSHGLDANDSVRIKDADITIAAGKDGIHAENSDDASLGFVYVLSGTLDITAEGDGISSGYYMQIEGGSFTILAGGGYENGSQHSSDNWGSFGGGGMQGGGGGMQGGGRPHSSDGTNVNVQTTGTSSAGSSSSTTTTDDGSTSMKGLKSGSSILINGGTFDIDSADDGIHSNMSAYINNGTFAIASGDDGIHAEEELTITGGTININESYEGLEALEIYITGGTFIINASDDGLNASGGTDSSGMTGGRDGMFGGGGMGGSATSANGNIEISGGNLTIYASGDGLDSNGNLTISGGYTYVTNPTSGDTSVLDSQNEPVITGGTYIGIGITTMMAETFSSSSTQGVIAASVGSQSAGSEITVTDSEGNVLVSVESEYSVAIIIISTPDIVKGESYDVVVGAASGSLEAQ